MSTHWEEIELSENELVEVYEIINQVKKYRLPHWKIKGSIYLKVHFLTLCIKMKRIKKAFSIRYSRHSTVFLSFNYTYCSYGIRNERCSTV